MNILVEALRIFEGVATSVADQARDGLGQAPVPIGGDSEHHSRLHRIIRLKETELATINQLTDALSARFPTSQTYQPRL